MVFQKPEYPSVDLMWCLIAGTFVWMFLFALEETHGQTTEQIQSVQYFPEYVAPGLPRVPDSKVWDKKVAPKKPTQSLRGDDNARRIWDREVAQDKLKERIKREGIKQAVKTLSKCCSDACTCGCNQGKPCKCKTSSPAPVMKYPPMAWDHPPIPMTTPIYRTAPVFQPTPAYQSAPSYQPMFPAFQGLPMFQGVFSSGPNCGPSG